MGAKREASGPGPRQIVSVSLDLRLLGAWQADLNGSPLPPLPTRHARALLARLVLLHPRPAPRAALLGELFPRLTPDGAAHHLRTTLYYLRRALGDYLWSTSDQVGLAPSLGVRHDIEAFETASAPGAPLAALREALALYRGPLLEHPADGWAARLAQQLHARYVDVLRRVVALAQIAGRPDLVLEAAGRWVAEEPWSDEAHLALIDALVARGERAAAEGQIARARALLRAEWGESDSPPLAALVRAVARLPKMPLARPAEAAAQAWPLAARKPPRPDEVMDFDRLPLIGRAVELGLLQAAWARAHQGLAQILVVEGAAGIGKSRLLCAFVADVRLHADSLVLWGVANDQTAGQTLGLLRDAVARAGSVDGARVGLACTALDDLTWGVLCRHLPELAAHAPGRAPASVSPLEGPSEIARRDHLLRLLLDALAARGPLLLILEGNDQVDAETLGLFAALADTPRRAMAVIARRPPSHTAGAAALGALSPAPRIALASLDAGATAELIRAALGDLVDPDLVARLGARSGGNPLFVREILRALVVQGALRWDLPAGWRLAAADLPIPDPVLNLLALRLAPLSRRARLLSNLLAVLGRPASNTLLTRLWPDEASRLAAQAELLERRVMAERDARLRFDHDWLRESLLTTLDAAVRAALHARIAAALRAHPGADPAERARHHAGAQEWEAALADALAVAGHALSEGRYPALGQALALVEQALDALCVAPHDERRWQLLALRERHCAATVHGEGWLARIDALHALAEAASNDSWRAEALIRRGQALRELGRYHEAEAVLRRGVALADQARLPAAATIGYVAFAYLLDSAGASEEALDVGRAAARAAAATEPILQISALAALGYLEVRAERVPAADERLTALLAHPVLGRQPALASNIQQMLGLAKLAAHRYEAGHALVRQSLQSAELLGDVFQIFATQTGIAVMLLMTGFYAEARPLAEALLPTLRRLPEPRQSSLIIGFLGKAVLFAGDAPRAWELVEEALAIIGSRRMPEYRAGFQAFAARIALAQSRQAEAQAVISAAEQAQAGIRHPAQIVDHVAAQVWLRAGQPERARAAARRAIASLPDQGYGAMMRVEVLWEAADVLAAVEGPQAALPLWERAYATFLGDISGMASLTLRRAFLAGSPFYRRLTAFQSERPRRLVFLPLPDAPTGRPLHPDELAPVVWTIREPADPAAGAPLRHAQLRRLAAEAVAQGAVATVEALAEALAVAPRTVQRALRQLEAAGIVVETRGRRGRG